MTTTAKDRVGELLTEACELGDESIRLGIKAAKLDLHDIKRWPLYSRMLEINHRIKEIAKEYECESRDALRAKAHS